jgi:putative hydrolase
MYNLHSHTLLSDGVLLPSELCVRYAAAGYKAIAITDHADYSNIENVVSSIRRFCSKLPKDFPLVVLPGVELTHLPLAQFKPLAAYCRANGIKIIIGHGETVSEPVLAGTNRACLEADIDILAHPGHISGQDVKLAARRGIFLEITTRKSHGATNREVAAKAARWNAKLVLNHDSHAPCDILSPARSVQIARSCGLTEVRIKEIVRQTAALVSSRIK